MNCPRCGAVVQPGQARCSCGRYLAMTQSNVDIPNEFYDRIEDQVEKTGKENFRRGLLIGLGFLALFLLLETIMDTVFIARNFFIGAVLLAAAGLIGFNLWQLVRKYLT